MSTTPDPLHTRTEHAGSDWVVIVDVDGSDQIDSRHPTQAEAERAEQALHDSVRASAEVADDRAS
jgi:hypothetical protein